MHRRLADGFVLALRRGSSSGVLPTGSCVVVGVGSVVLPVTESLNSRIPLPSDRPISGRRFAPKRRSATSRRRMISQGADVSHEPG